MALLTRLLALTRLSRLPGGALRTDPLAGPPLEFRTQDRRLFRTQDGVYFGVKAHG